MYGQKLILHIFRKYLYNYCIIWIRNLKICNKKIVCYTYIYKLLLESSNKKLLFLNVKLANKHN